MPIAYSYLRFSSPEQAKGDSVRRQTEATAEWCVRNGVALDATLALRDEGVSAFRGKNREDPDVHGLAAFLRAVKTGRVPVGSYLVLENLDRLSRESIVPAVNLFTSILLAGVHVVQLAPREQTFDRAADMSAIMLAIVELSRGHSESVMKSDRCGKAWANKRKTAATKVLTRRVPVWIRYEDGKLTLDPEKAKTVRRVFGLAIDGMGLTQIARKLNEGGVPVLGRQQLADKGDKGRKHKVVWSAATVHKLLTSRATLGEYQPHRGRPGARQPVGPLLRDYYPQLITPEQFAAAQAALRSRFIVGRGRPGRHVNLFAGLLRDARGGGSYITRHHKKRESVLFPAKAAFGQGDKWVSFPLKAFESCILSRLIEVKIEDLQPDAPAPSRVETLSGRKTELEALITKWRAKMDTPELVDVVAEKLVELERERREVTERLTEAQREESSPLSEAVGQLRVVGQLLAEDNGDENRLRCRAAIRRAIESVWCLFRPGRGERAGVVQVWFRNGAHRDYIIAGRPEGANARGRRPARWHVASFAATDGLDLRKQADVKKVERLLAKLTLAGTPNR